MSKLLTGANQLVTGEAVPVDLRVARLGSRMIAALIDLTIQSVALVVLLLVGFFVIQPDDPALIVALLLVVNVAVLLGYPVVFETFSRGRTVGKIALGLRAVRDDGGPLRFRHALTRGLVGVVAEGPSMMYLPAMISMVVSSRSKRLGDLFAGTVVLQVRVPQPRVLPPAVPPQLAGWAALLDLTGVDDGLAVRGRYFLNRTHQLTAEVRERMGTDLVREINAVITPPAPPGTPGWAIVATVLAERTRRAYVRLVAGGVPSGVQSGPGHPVGWTAGPNGWPAASAGPAGGPGGPVGGPPGHQPPGW